MNRLLHSLLPSLDCSACAEVQFRMLAEQMPDIVLRMDADARFLYVNSRIQDLTGHKPEEFFGKTCREAGMSEECGLLWEAIARDTLEKGKGIDREVHLEIKDKLRILHVRSVCDTMPAAPPTFIATVRDITAMRRDERHIQELVQRLTHHINNTPLAVMEWDPEGKCLIWNGEAEEMFGWTRRELKSGRVDCLALIHPDDKPGFGIILERLKQGQAASDFVKCRALHQNGSLLFCECHLSALLDADGHAKSILWVANNVTVRKALEVELISISEREHRRIGHDLHDGVCQELSGVRYSLEAISKQRRKGTVLRQQIDQLSGALERAVHHIRLLSRGLAPLELEGGNLAAALDELAANTSALFQVQCVVKCRGRSQRLEIEKAINLFRIAQEAIQNAIKHGDSTQIRMDLDLLQGTLAITDNGNGIKDDDPAPARGNGMGLKIMRHRADLIQGIVALERIPSGGVRVICHFPK